MRDTDARMDFRKVFEKRGLSVAQVAEAIGVEESTVYRWVTDKDPEKLTVRRRGEETRKLRRGRTTPSLEAVGAMVKAGLIAWTDFDGEEAA